MKKIAIIIPPEWELFFLLWLQDFIYVLSKYYNIDIYLFQRNPGVINLPKNINIFNYALYGYETTKKYKNIKALLPKKITNQNLGYLSFNLKKYKYDLCIANEKSSFVIAKKLLQKETKIVYWPTELYTHNNGVYEERTSQLIKFEQKNIKSIDLLLLTDKNREKEYYNIIQKEYTGNKIYLPISVKVEKKKEISFHDLFNIPKEKKLVLYNGNISLNGRYVKEIVEVAQNFDEDIFLILSGPNYGRFDFIDTLKKIDINNKVFFYNSLVDSQTRYNLFNSVDIGLAFYDNNILNNELTVKSSDKIASYFRSKLPVISFNYENYNKFYKKYNCGKTINTIDELPNTINEILSNYNLFSKNAFKAYNKFYNTNKNMKKLIKVFDEL